MRTHTTVHEGESKAKKREENRKANRRIRTKLGQMQKRTELNWYPTMGRKKKKKNVQHKSLNYLKKHTPTKEANISSAPFDVC